MDNWYKKSFSEDYIRTYQHRDLDEAELALDNLLEHIDLPEDPRCLDLCCGFGRHVAYLNKKGIHTLGIDLSTDLLRYAADDRRIRKKLVQSDMRTLPFKNCFDFVFSFFSSFGYFPDDCENIKVLQEIGRVLKPKGGLLMDYLNAGYVRTHLKKEDRQKFSEFELTQRRWINNDDNFVEKEILIDDADGQRRYRERVKLYTPDDFARFFAATNFKITKMMGSLSGQPYSEMSERLVIVGEKIDNELL